MLIQRLQKLSQRQSCFLFGARGTGKTTLLKQLFSQKAVLWIDFLSFEDEDRFSRNPDLLSELLSESAYRKVIIDEVQKVPKILDLVHKEMERNKKIQFILTGSSSRKLKRGGGNLLAGRAASFALHPLTYLEAGARFNLQNVLQTGSLPAVLESGSVKDKARALNSYVGTYLKEEVLTEQLVRKIRPFREFLNIAAQCCGQIVNYSRIAEQLKTDWSTVRNYFEILNDTYLGFYLKSFDRSVRRQQSKAPKFFFFDLGAQRALLKRAQISLSKGSYEYGTAFERFLILEAIRLNNYYERDMTFSYLRDHNGNEIDLIVQKPSGEEILIEIKSTDRASKNEGKVLEKFALQWDRPFTAQVWSQDKRERKTGSVHFYHWKSGLQKLIGLS